MEYDFGVIELIRGVAIWVVGEDGISVFSGIAVVDFSGLLSLSPCLLRLGGGTGDSKLGHLR